MLQQSRTSSHSQRPHWSAIAAALVAMGALWINAPGYTGVPIIAAGLVAALFVEIRLPGNPLLLWPIRVVLFTVIITTSGDRHSRTSTWFLDPDYINLFGYLCAAELLVQVWHRHKSGAPRSEVLLLSALIMAAATNTYDRRHIQYLAPVYALFLTISLREFLPKHARIAGSWASRGRQIVAICLMLVIGFLTATGLREYGDRVTIYPMTGIFKQSRIAVTGMSSIPRLGTSRGLHPVGIRVLRVQGRWAGGHLRGASFDTYSAGEWGPPTQQRQYIPATPADLHTDDSGQRLRITRLSRDLDDLLYLPLNSAGVDASHAAAVEWDSGHNRIVRAQSESESLLEYEAILSRFETHQGPLCMPMDEKLRARCLEVPPEIDARVRALAHQIAPAGSPVDRVRAIERYLQANHSYSMSIEPGEGEPICDFLLNKRSAHCQYFASAAAILLRCVGVPARYVNGYYVHEASGSGQFIVRQRDAHAWTEAWIDGIGWVTVDATPASGRPDAFAKVGGWQRFSEWMRDSIAAAKAWIAALDWKRICITGGILLAAVYGLSRLLPLLRRRRIAAIRKYDYETASAELLSLGAGFDRLLRRRGMPCPPHRTWRQHVRMIPRQSQDEPAFDAELAEAFVRDYDAARFGMRDDRVTELRRTLTLLERPPRRTGLKNGDTA